MVNSKKELDFFLDYFSKSKFKHVLEWGSGESTILYSAKCPQLVSWLSIEHCNPWYDRGKALIKDPRISLHYVPPNVPNWDDNCGRNGDYEEFKDYVDFPKGKKFDCIFVDGRARVPCMQASMGLLSEGAIVILHDCMVPHYKPGINLYKKVFQFQTIMGLKP